MSSQIGAYFYFGISFSVIPFVYCKLANIFNTDKYSFVLINFHMLCYSLLIKYLFCLSNFYSLLFCTACNVFFQPMAPLVLSNGKLLTENIYGLYFSLLHNTVTVTTHYSNQTSSPHAVAPSMYKMKIPCTTVSPSTYCQKLFNISKLNL
jgi:hypothetical protein